MTTFESFFFWIGVLCVLPYALLFLLIVIVLGLAVAASVEDRFARIFRSAGKNRDGGRVP